MGLLVAAVVLRAIGASAASNATDPDDVTGNVDIKTISTADTATDITFKVDTYADFSDTIDFYTMEWGLDFNNNGSLGDDQDGCIFLETVSGGGLRATLYHVACSGGNADEGTSEATKTSAHVEVAFPLVDLTKAGLVAANGFKYLVKSEDTSGNKDAAPDQPASGPPTLVAATVGGEAPTPTPTPTATPTGSATPTPTPNGSASPTPTGSATPSLDGTDPSATPGVGVGSASSTGSGSGGTSSTSGGGGATLPTTGLNIAGLLLAAGALTYGGIELLGVKFRFPRRSSG